MFLLRFIILVRYIWKKDGGKDRVFKGVENLVKVNEFLLFMCLGGSGRESRNVKIEFVLEVYILLLK